VFAGFLGKKKRAASDHVAKITLSDLAKYFDMPIAEASKNLNVGLTVLKRKCREFGIPRWPHRKIKSLDSLIHDLQVLLHFLFIIMTLRISVELYTYIHTYQFPRKLL
jgi:hypothetical protein